MPSTAPPVPLPARAQPLLGQQEVQPPQPEQGPLLLLRGWAPMLCMMASTQAYRPMLGRYSSQLISLRAPRDPGV